MEKNWKVICAASFYFIVTHYSAFCWLISASRSLSLSPGGSCSARGLLLGIRLRGVPPWITAKEQLQLNVASFICISMQRSGIRAPASAARISGPACNAALGLMVPSQEWLLPSEALWSPYLAASPQSPDKVLFSQSTGGWLGTPLRSSSPAALARMQKVIP